MLETAKVRLSVPGTGVCFLVHSIHFNKSGLALKTLSLLLCALVSKGYITRSPLPSACQFSFPSYMKGCAHWTSHVNRGCAHLLGLQAPPLPPERWLQWHSVHHTTFHPKASDSRGLKIFVEGETAVDHVHCRAMTPPDYFKSVMLF